MSDYSESGAQPVEDAAVPDPPTVDEVLARRDRAENDDSAEAPAADPTYDEPGDNPWLRRTTTDRAVVVGIQP